MSKLNIEEILESIQSVEKTASAKKSLMDVLTEDDSATLAAQAAQAEQEKLAAAQAEAEKLAAEEAAKAEQEKLAAEEAAKNAQPLTDEELYEKVANLESTREKLAEADMVGRMMARAYFDQLQQMGIFGMTNQPEFNIGGERIDMPFPYGLPTPSSAQTKTASAEDEASEIISALYNKYSK